MRKSRSRPTPPPTEPHPLQISFGRRVREMRRRLGLSQEALAERLAMSVDAVSSIERGKTFVSPKTLAALESALDTPAASFFSDPVGADRVDRLRAIGRLLEDQSAEVLAAAEDHVKTLVRVVSILRH